jgi:acyl transferase domain-containing protein
MPDPPKPTYDQLAKALAEKEEALAEKEEALAKALAEKEEAERKYRELRWVIIMQRHRVFWQEREAFLTTTCCTTCCVV